VQEMRHDAAAPAGTDGGGATAGWPWWAATPRVRAAVDMAPERLQAVTAFATVFVAFQDGTTNRVVAARHRGEPLAGEGAAPLPQTYCSLVGAAGGRLYIPRTTDDPRTQALPVTETLGPTAFVGVPIQTATGEWLGTVCGIDRSPRAPREDDWRWLELMAQLLGALADAEFAAALDPVTGLFTRWFCLERAPAWWRQRRGAEPEAVACVVLDLDGFKAVNDQWGHRRGDALLRAVGGGLRGVVPPDAVVARWGGDEFVVLWPLREEGEAGRLDVAGLVSVVPAAAARVAPGLAVTACAGMGVGRWTAEHWERVWRRADRALYQAKAQGPGTWRGAGEPAE
jgi:diguanylate cyclase (GGDEF)-like protein